MMRLGNQTASSAATPREPFDYAVASGFDAFEWFPDKKPGSGWDDTDLDGALRRQLRTTAQSRGLRLSVHARWQANPLQPAAHALLAKDLDLARDLGASLVNLHLYQERGIPAFVEAIRPLIERTREAGLQLAIENTPHHAPEEFNELFAHLRRLDSSAVGHVGMCLDLGHANLCAATRNDYLRFVDRLASLVPIIHLHLHENYGDADTHLPLFTGPAGRDDSGIRGLLARLRRRRFAGSVIFEQWPQPPSLLNQARDRLLGLWAECAPPPAAEVESHPDAPAGTASRIAGPVGAAAVPLEAFARKLVAGNHRCRSWREKLDFVRELLAAETDLAAEQLVDVAVYLRFLGTGEIPCAEDGRHFRPAHHARIAQQIQERLAALGTPKNAFILRKIYPWLPSTAREFQRAEPLTRIRDIAHRNDIPAELKSEIKRSLQNKLHRCAGPEDLATSAALLARVTAPTANFAPEFVAQFRIFHEELKEFFNARSLAERLAALLPAVNRHNAGLIQDFLAEKARAHPAATMDGLRSLTELRRGLAAEAALAPPLESPEFVLADIALEDCAFAWLSDLINTMDRAGAGAAWEAALELLPLTLVNLELSGVEIEECRVLESELRAWQPLAPADREQLLRLKASISRARRLAENFSDRILAWFPPRAAVLGRALAVPETAVRVFGEAEIRGHLVFQLSKLVSSLLRRLRGALGQQAWDVVVSGQATGRVVSAGGLDGGYSEPALLLWPRAEGDEEIPAGVAGLVLAQELPHLSHLGVRARQAGVVVVVAEEVAQFDELKRFEGELISLAASTEKVAWQPAREAMARSNPSREVRIPEVELSPAPACIPLEQAWARRGGNKADGVRRLAELAQHPDAGFKTPPGLVIPFGALAAVLQATPDVAEAYQRLLQAVDATTQGLTAARQLQDLIRQLRLPATLLAGVAAHFGGDTRIMVRSSANVEDLANLSGAGLYESVANVSPTEVAPAVLAVWASLWTRRAVLSRQQAGLPHSQAHMAVLLQEMLVPDFSFILHTVNPLNHHAHEAYAELVVGLGETLASAATRGNPYRLVCDRKSGAVATLAFANFSHALWPDPAGGVRRQTVDYSRIPLSFQTEARTGLGRRLAALAEFVESAFHAPQDLEGVVNGEGIHLVQSRPQPGL